MDYQVIKVKEDILVENDMDETEVYDMHNIVENVLNEFMRKEVGDEDSIEITPNMNLSEFSPLEIN